MARLASTQLIGATFAFQHLAFAPAIEAIRGLGLREIELWGIAPHLDLFDAIDARGDVVRRVLADHGLSIWCFTPEQVIYPVNIASGDAELRRDSVDRRAADICVDLGARYLFLASGRSYRDEPPGAAWDRAAESIAVIAAHAARIGHPVPL